MINALLVLNGLVSMAGLVVVVKLAYDYGRLRQMVEDIEEKGCSRRRNGACNL